MPKEGSNAWYRAYADRFYLDKANRDTYLYRQAATVLGLVGGLYMGGAIDMNQALVSDLPAPSGDNDAARKKYVDDLIDADVVVHAALTATHGVSGSILGTEDIDDTPVDGAISKPPSSNWAYDHAINYLLHNKLVRKSADETVNNSSTLQNDDELLLAIAANEVWAFELMLFNTSPSAADIKFALTIPTGASMLWLPPGTSYWSIAAAWTSSGLGINASGGALAVMGNASTIGFQIKGFVVCGATAGNLQLQWAQNAATVGDTIVHTNSWLGARRLA